MFWGPTPYSYMKTGYHSVRDTIRDQIPIDVEIKRARDLIDNLKPEIAANLRIIAREEVEVSKLQNELSRKTASLDKSKTAILKLKEDLESGIQRVSYGGKSYNMDQVKNDLSGRFKQFQIQEATHDKLAGILEARQRNLDAARQKLEAILAAKRQHEVTVENLQARYTMHQVSESTSQYTLNDSALTSVRQTLEDISTRLDVAEKLVEMDVEDTGIPVLEEDLHNEDIVNQITNYFGTGSSKLNQDVDSSDSQLVKTGDSNINVIAAKPASVQLSKETTEEVANNEEGGN